MSMSEQTKHALFESAMLLEEARSLLINSYSDEEVAPIMVPKAVAIVADALANLQDKIYKKSGTKVIGLDFPTRMGVAFERKRYES